MDSKKIVTIYFGRFGSEYIGSPFIVGGNQIYSAIIRECGLDAIQSAVKISAGIFHTISVESIGAYPNKHSQDFSCITYNKKDWRGWLVGESINLNKKTIRTYDDFFQLRNYHTPFVKDSVGKSNVGVNQGEFSDFNRIMRRHGMIIKSGDKISVFSPDRLSFFIISDTPPEIKELSIGAKRNLGFGRVVITNKYTFNLDDLDYSKLSDNKKVIDTAKNGIYGVLNHKKYGYGEFQIENWKDRFLIRLMTPLCLSSSMDDTHQYEKQCNYMQGDVYRRHQEVIWRKGHPETLFCISDGSVFTYVP